MSSVIIRPSARRDLAGIWSYTVETWSVDQADNYVRTLDNDMQRLREYPELGAPHPTRLANFRKLASGHHLIFYLLDGQDIEIVRILHERMDVDDKLS